MITEHKGSIFDSGCDALVNPVNTRGVCGAGLAKEFKERFPFAYKDYLSRCNGPVLGPVKIGSCLCSLSGVTTPPRFIVHFPTKDDWRNPSRMDYITQGLDFLVASLKCSTCKSIAIPALGCGLGGLNWDAVKAEIVSRFETMPEDFLLELYSPR